MGGNIAKNKKEEIPKYREKTPCYENRELSWRSKRPQKSLV